MLWIGGVGVVATVLTPAIRRSRPPEERFAAFHALESGFAHQARITTVLAGASGLYMTWRLSALELVPTRPTPGGCRPWC